MAKYYQYYVEGQDEEKLIQVLKTELRLIEPGKVEKFNVVSEELTKLRIMSLKMGTIVVLVFDTDAGNINTLKKNIKFLKEQKAIKNVLCNGVQREHNKKLNNGLPILHKVPPKRDYGRYFCIMAEKGGTSHGGLTEKLSLFFHAKKQEVNAYGR
ncbi:Uncharacterised protein [uncultured Blautia sp.]|nr:hypothetical protein [uncultured Blautia sp.]SCI29950.1 Uncharacterised protein [uncultured Blautia sp.]